MVDLFKKGEFSEKLLREVTKHVSRDAEEIARRKLNEKLSEGNSDQHIELDFSHSFRISAGKSADITFNTSYEKIRGEQRERVRGYSYRNKNGKTVHVQPQTRVNRDTRKFQTDDGKYITSDEIPDEVFQEVFTEAVQEALSNAFEKLNI